MFPFQRQKKYIRAFKDAYAIDENSGKSLDELHLKDSPAFRKMLDVQMIINCGKDKYYLNEPVIEMLRNTRNHFLRIIVIILILFLLALLLGMLTRQ